MTFRDAFNRAADFAIHRPAWQYKLVTALLCSGLVLGWIHHWESSLRSDGKQELRDSLTAATALRWHAKKDSVADLLAREDPPLTRILHRTDTLLRQIPETIVTHEDTVRAIQGLPALRLATDSAIRACSEYQDWFARYRTMCDSLDYARQAQIAALKRQIDAVKPSRTRPIVTWIGILGAAYVGYRVGKR